MKKLIKRKPVGQYLNIDTQGDIYHFDIQELIIFLNNALTEGATHINIDGESEYESCSNIYEIAIQPIALIEETDAEFNVREKEEEAEDFRKRRFA